MWDFHLHSSFSSDSREPMENMVKKAIELGLEEICFTEHYDTDLHVGGEFQTNLGAYRDELIRLREKYHQIKLRFGIESGYMPSNVQKTDNMMRGYDFDFIIGSVHSVNEVDIYYMGCQPSDRERMYRAYLEETLAVLRKAVHYNVLGHINYPSKMEAFKAKPMRSSDSPELCDDIFTLLIQNGKGMEFNTSSMRHSRETGSTIGFLSRFKELGGEIITIGTDAHSTQAMNFMYNEALEALKAAGFKYICTFEKMEPSP